MDKYEFNIKVEQIKKLINKSDYGTAMKIADTIDWKRVRNTNLLSMVATVYEKNEEYQEAKDILLLAFERAPIGKRLLYKLTELALKEGNTSEAEAYYREFCDLASDDPRQNLLRYLILKEKGAPMEQLIHSLESYISIELDEKWMYELAELYQTAGMKDECVRMCDKIMLMFGLGHYVDKAMELKVQHAPLTQYQMDLVENRDKYEARLRKVEAEFNGSYRQQDMEPDDEYDDAQESAVSRAALADDLEAKMQEVEVEERLAAEMSRISIEDYPDDDQLEKTRTFTDLKNLKTNTEHVVKAMPGVAAGIMGAAGAGSAAAEAAAHTIVTAGRTAIHGAGDCAHVMAADESSITAETDVNGYQGQLPDGYDRPVQSGSYAPQGYGASDHPLNRYNESGYFPDEAIQEDGGSEPYEEPEYSPSAYDQAGSGQENYLQEGSRQSDYSQYDDDQAGYDQMEAGMDGYDQAGYSQTGYGEDGGQPEDYNQDELLPEYEEVPAGHYVMIEEISPARGLELAVETLKYIHRELGTRHQVAKITGEKLNNRGVFAVSDKIAGKDLVVEQAGALSDIVMEELDELLEQDKTGMNVILIDSPRRIEIICLHNPNLAEKFERVSAAEEEDPIPDETPAAERESSPGLQVVQPVRDTQPAIGPDEEEYDNEPATDPEDDYADDSYEEEADPETSRFEEKPKSQEKPEPKRGADELSAEEFAQLACRYAGDIDCSITGKSMLALYERIEIMEEDGIPLTKENAEQLIEEAADKAEKPSFGKLLKGIVSPKYDKDGLLILKEEHFIN